MSLKDIWAMRIQMTFHNESRTADLANGNKIQRNMIVREGGWIYARMVGDDSPKIHAATFSLPDSFSNLPLRIDIEDESYSAYLLRFLAAVCV